MLDDVDLARLLRYILGEYTPEEATDTEQWIAQDPVRARAAASLEQLWGTRTSTSASASSTPEWNVDEAWHQFTDTSLRARDVQHRRTHGRRPLKLVPHATQVTPARRWVQRVSAIAAVLVVGIAGSLIWRSESTSDHPARVAQQTPDTAGMHEFRTTRAQLAEVRLTDGTIAKLAPASRLRVSRDYGTGARDLYLDGEAYFEVRHDVAHPFRIYTSHGVSEDIGTKFGIRAYRADTVVRVAVAEGAVLLHAATPSVHHTGDTKDVITAGHVGVLPPSGQTQIRSVPDMTRYLAWTDGRLVFHDAPLRDVVTELGRWYGIDIRLADANLGKRLYTASFHDEAVSEVLQALEVALDVRARHDGNVIVLTDHRGSVSR